MESVKEMIQEIRSQGRSMLLEHEAKEVCRSYGLRAPCSAVVTNEEQARAKADELGFPLVAKVVSPDILHKSDCGGVILGLSDSDQVVTAFRNIVQSAQHNCPTASVEGVLLEAMVPSGTEVIAGCMTDPQFGKAVMFGLGGLFVEVYSDVAFRIVPVSREDATEMIEELRGYSILKGARGRPKVRLDVIQDLITNLSRMVQDLDVVDQVDLNPVILRESDATVVDAKIILRDG